MATGGEPSPGAASTLTPQANRGDQASGAAAVQAMIKIGESVLARWPPDSAEYRAVLKALTTLTGAFKRQEDRGQDLLSAELRTRLADAASPQGAPPPAPAASAGSLPPGATRGMPSAGPAPS
jgi:hypothetical protein